MHPFIIHSWSALYASDLAFHAAAPSAAAATDALHAGTTWFAEARAEQRSAAFLAAQLPRRARACASVLDLGTGNGAMLRALRRRGWRGPLVGADYCAESVELAGRLEAAGGGDASSDEDEDGDEDEDQDEDEEAVATAVEEDAPPIAFYEFDILHSDAATAPWLPTAAGGFDVVLDKGTFDAVSLSDEMDAQGRRACEGYAPRVERLVRPGGLVLVTSCNWTEEELVQWFTPSEGAEGFEQVGKVAYPRFRYAGREGQTVAGVCFQKDG